MAQYNSKYSGAQIDEAVGRAISGGSIDKSLAGKAPAGFGFGEKKAIIEEDTEEEFNAKLDALLTTMPIQSGMLICYTPYPDLPDGSYHLGILHKHSDIHASLYGLPNYGSNGQYKRLNKGVWYPFEWIDPPMNVGVEYRTTERYIGKPVYAKLLNFGALPNSTSKSFAHEISDLNFVVDIYGSGVAGQDVKVSVDTTNITITSTSNLSSVTAYPVIKYTKTTD